MSLSAPLARAPILLCVLLLGACQFARAPLASSASPRPTRVEVFSDHWEDLTIYLERDGVRSRLGTVNGNSSRVLEIRDDLLGLGGWVRLVAVESGRRDHVRSDVFAMQKGESATWRTGPRDYLTPVVVMPPG